jgi:CHRD domain
MQSQPRLRMFAVPGIVAALVAGAGASFGHDDSERHRRIETRLKSYNEVPSVSSVATGSFKARFDGVGAIDYELSFSGLEGTVTQSHIHFGQKSVNGGIMVWLCQTATNVDPTGLAPTCPQSGSVSGTIQAANVIGPATQGVASLEFDEFVKAIRVGSGYVNVHSSKFPGGELRGQLGRSDHD